MSAPMSAAELRKLIEGQTTTDLPTAARAFGVGRDWAYGAFERGELPFPAFRLGRAIKVPTAPLGRLLGIVSDEVRPASVADISAGQDRPNGVTNHSPPGNGSAPPPGEGRGHHHDDGPAGHASAVRIAGRVRAEVER